MARTLSDHEKEKGTYFCSVSHNIPQCLDMIKTLPDFTYWAYIFHEPDTEEGSPHCHFLVRHNGSRSVKQIAEKLGISPQYVQVCRKVTAFRRYMLHLDQDEKKKYSLDDIKTSDILTFKEAISGNTKKDVLSIYRSFSSLSQGRVTVDEFIQENWVEFQRMSFATQIKIFKILHETWGAHDTT